MSGFPVIGTGGDPIPNLVYAAQLFPQRANPWPSLDSLGQRQPLFISEWGGLSAHLAWGERTALHMRAAGIGWTAAHWNGEPFLVRISERQSLATGFGAIVRRELALTGEPSLATQPAPPPTLMD
jgi:hypothetical protein